MLDETGQAVSVAPIRRFPEEGLEVLPNDGVEDGVVGVARLIRVVGMRHALAYPVLRATPMPRDGYTVSVLRGAPGCR